MVRKRVKSAWWYGVFVAPFGIAAYVFCSLAGMPTLEFGKWVMAIGFGAALGSIIGTEITFWQVKHRGLGLVDETMNQLTRKFKPLIKFGETLQDALQETQQVLNNPMVADAIANMVKILAALPADKIAKAVQVLNLPLEAVKDDGKP
jgi:urease gamma subunit